MESPGAGAEETDALWLTERLLQSCCAARLSPELSLSLKSPPAAPGSGQLFLLGELAKCVSLGAGGLGQELWVRTGGPGWWKEEGRSGAGG